MAPRKPTADKKAQEEPAIKKSEDRVVKRPARGYHRFKNGMLNVMPKGGEKALVNSNQNSPLLRLPPEIRNRIWEYMVGGMEFRQTLLSWQKRLFRPKRSKRANIFAILRVCRQIYAETALLPVSVNSFSTKHSWSLRRAVRLWRAYQRNQLTELQIEITTSELQRPPEQWLIGLVEDGNFALLPALRRIRVCLFLGRMPEGKVQPLAEYAKLLYSAVGSKLASAGYELVVEEMDVSWRQHDDNWNGWKKVEDK